MNMEDQIQHLSTEQLEAALPQIGASPKNEGSLEMIVRRPADNEREVLEIGELDTEVGLVGDNWIHRSSSRSEDGKAHPDMQINIMNSRVIDLIATRRDRWKLAGDQLYVDFDLSEENAPAGTRLTIGEATLEVTDQPHTGCTKFVDRFGLEAMKFVNAKPTRHLHLRGINAKVIRSGSIKTGDQVTKG